MRNFTSVFKISALALLIGSTISVNAQQQNALSFDGVDDYLVAPAASGSIAGSNQISMTCWVYPSNPTPSTTSYDGICGLRNNTSGDFYILHYGTNTVECRFRNSAGTNFDILGQGIQLNTWQHLALTYDGAKIRYYRNGIKLDSIAANGTISIASDAFYIGGLPFQTSIFYLIGKIDEVSLWRQTLTQSEINCIYKGEIDTTSANLKLYYKFNQGVANGTNTTVTTAIDNSGHINAALSGFALTGTTSNWVSGGVNTFTSVAASICPGGVYTFGTQTLSTAGNYTEVFTSSAGCDSVVKLALNVGTIDTSVTVANNVLTATQNAATYQWINCVTGLPIPGATNKNYSSTVGGTFAVIVSFANCSDTSGCRTVAPVGMAEGIQSKEVALYPNPSTNQFTVDLGKTQHDVTVSVKSLEGKEMIFITYSDIKQFSVNAVSWSSGVYIMELSTPVGKAYKRLMKK